MKDSHVFLGLLLAFAILGCIAFWLWFIDKCWPLAVTTMWFLALAVIALVFRRSAKKYNV